MRTLSLEEYVAGVLAGESSVFRSEAGLGAMAIAARTYARFNRGRHSRDGYDFCSTTHCQRVELRDVSPRVEQAATDTAGELLWYRGKPASTPYTRDCGGRSERDSAFPYLTVHSDPYCKQAWRWAASAPQIVRALRAEGLKTPADLNRVTILDRTISGRARTLELSGHSGAIPISAGAFRFAIGRQLGWNLVRSDLYEVHGLLFDGRGSGHGAGLCQDGADQMGLQGRSVKEILTFYYPGTLVGLNARGVQWSVLSGEKIRLYSTRPEQEKYVLAAASRAYESTAVRLHFTADRAVELRVYPDLETYRNATGEPGWVAARANGMRVDLQPAEILRGKGLLDSTLKHEFLHVVVEQHAAIGMPAWFREGLVEYLAGHDEQAGQFRWNGEGQARLAHVAARRRVAQLIVRYGESAVMSWVSRGIPREAINMSASQEVTKRR